MHSCAHKGVFNKYALDYNLHFVHFCFYLVDKIATFRHCRGRNMAYLVVPKQILGKNFLSLQNEQSFI